MAKDGRSGATELCLQVNLETERSTGGVSSDGPTVAVTKASSITTKFVAKASIRGRTAGLTKGVGSTIRWMDLAFSPGPTAKCTEGNTKMIINTVKGSSFGRTESGTKACGGKEFSTARESVPFLITPR